MPPARAVPNFLCYSATRPILIRLQLIGLVLGKVNILTINHYLTEASQLLVETAKSGLDEPVVATIEILVKVISEGKPVLVCGNGGSAADAMHIAGELMGRYLLDRSAYNVISLGSDPAITTAWSNDFGYESLFARQVEGLGASGGALWCLSTSGNSENVVRAAATAKERGMTTIAFTGQGGGRLANADILVAVPSASTARIQEVHTCLYHYVCEQAECRLSGGADL